LLHIYFGVVTDGEAIINAQDLMSKYTLTSCGCSLVFIEMLLGLFADLDFADLIIRIEKLIRDISRIDHKLQLRFDDFLCEDISVVSFHLEDKE
jgi:hypothetical protein